MRHLKVFVRLHLQTHAHIYTVQWDVRGQWIKAEISFAKNINRIVHMYTQYIKVIYNTCRQASCNKLSDQQNTTNDEDDDWI